MEIRYLCPTCRAGNRVPLSGGRLPDATVCRSCGARLTLAAPGAVGPGPAPTTCAVCGDDKLYIQKDFSQKIGCLIVGIGAILVPWTYGLSLAACALIDFAFYRVLPWITVCYVCGSRYRGWRPDARLEPYDLVTAQTWEARALTWRRLNDRPA